MEQHSSGQDRRYTGEALPRRNGARRQCRHACLDPELHAIYQPNWPPILAVERRIARGNDIPIRGQSMTTWLLVSGDFTPLGGMDRANHALAKYIGARHNADIHLVT